MFPVRGLSFILIVISLITIIKLCPASAGEKDKGGHSIIMDGSNLIMKDHDKKKKGNTIVIKGSSRECECSKKAVPVPVPYPIMIPQKEVKYVHVPVHHGGSGWFGGHGMMPDGFARSDQILSEQIERPLVGIGEKLGIEYDIIGNGEHRFENDPSIMPVELGEMPNNPY